MWTTREVEPLKKPPPPKPDRQPVAQGEIGRPPRFVFAVCLAGVILMVVAISLVYVPAGIFVAGAFAFVGGAVVDWERLL